MCLKCSKCNKAYSEREPFSGTLQTECPNCGEPIPRGFTSPPSDLAEEFNNISSDDVWQENHTPCWEPEGVDKDHKDF